MKVFIYVQHLLGIGHLRRALLLARAGRGLGLEVAVASGGRAMARLAVDPIHQLPAAHCEPGDLSTLLDDEGAPVVDRWKRERCARLLELFEQERPDVLLIESFPFGRRQFRFELLPLLERARACQPRPRVICSIRDVLQRRAPRREAETVELLNRLFDEVWVHGDPDWIRLEHSFSRVTALTPDVRYTGYVAEPWPAGPSVAGRGVLVSAGGGAAGMTLMQCAARARRLTEDATAPWRFLVDGTAEQRARLADEAGPGAVVEPLRRDFKALLAGCRVSISQLGYNTAIELLQTGARAVVVPYEGRGETEQCARAAVLAAKGLLEAVPEAALGPATLAATVDRIVDRPHYDIPAIRLDGAERSARWLADLASA